MFKILGLAIIFCVCSSFGIMFSVRLGEKVTRLKAIRAMIEEISVIIRYKASPISEVIEEISNNSVFESLTFLKELKLTASAPVNDAWAEAVNASNLSDEEKTLVLEIGASLGTSDKDGQISSLELYKIKTAEQIELATKKYNDKSKLYRSLGVLCGAFLVVMLV